MHARLAIGGGDQNVALQLLQRPTLFHQSIGQVIEQVLSHRSLGAHSKVTWTIDQRSGEQVHPDAVGDHSRCQRVIPRDDGLRQIQTTAATFERFRFRSRDQRHETTGDFVTRPPRIASNEDSRRDRLSPISQHHGSAKLRGGRGQVSRDFRLHLLQPLAMSSIEELPPITAIKLRDATISLDLPPPDSKPLGIRIGLIDSRHRFGKHRSKDLEHHFRRLGRHRSQLPSQNRI